MAISHAKSLTIADDGNTDDVSPTHWNSVHNEFYTLSGNTTGNSTVSGSNIIWSAGVGVVLSGTSNSIVISGSAATFSLSMLGFDQAWAQGSVSLGQNSVYVYGEPIRAYLSAIALKVPVMVTFSSSAAASVQRGHTMDFGIYTRHSTNDTVLTLHYSTSYTIAGSHSSNASMRASYITGIGNSTSYSTTNTSSAGVNVSSLIHGPREFLLPISSLFTPGEYWFAIRQSSSSVGAAGNILNLSHLIASSQSVNALGIATNSSNDGLGRQMMYGVYSTTSGALPNGISQTQLNMGVTNPIFYIVPATQ